MRGIAPWEMLGIDLPPLVRRGGWYGKSWAGPEQNGHDVEGVLFFVDPELPKLKLIELIKAAKAEWEPHDVRVHFFPNGEAQCASLWSSADPLLKLFGPDALAEAWQVPREMVEGLC